MIWAGTISRLPLPVSRTTGCQLVPPTARMADSGGLTMALEAFDAEHAEVRDGERRAGHFLGLEFAGAAKIRELFDFLRQLANGFRVRLADDGDDQAVVEGDGDAQFDGAVLDDGSFGERRIDRRDAREGDGGGAGDEIGDRHLVRRDLLIEAGREGPTACPSPHQWRRRSAEWFAWIERGGGRWFGACWRGGDFCVRV